MHSAVVIIHQVFNRVIERDTFGVEKFCVRKCELLAWSETIRGRLI